MPVDYEAVRASEEYLGRSEEMTCRLGYFNPNNWAHGEMTLGVDIELSTAELPT